MTKKLDYSELVDRGFTLIRQSEWKKARKVFERLVNEYPTEPAPYAGLGAVYGHLDMHVKAETALRKSIELDPDIEYTWQKLGYVLFDQIRPAQAEDAFRRALSIDPESVWSLLGLADVLKYTDCYTEARDTLLRAAGIDPDEFWVWQDLGWAYIELRSYDRARQCFIRARERRRDCAYPLRGIAEAALRSGEIREARMYFEWALDMDPEYYLARRGLADVLVQQEQYAYAEELLKSLMKQCESDEVLWSLLGQVYLRTGRTALAEEAFDEALEEDHDLVEAHIGLLEIYEMQDRVEEAMVERERLRVLTEGEPMIQDVEDKMIQKVDASIREIIAELNHLGLTTVSCSSGLPEDHPNRDYRRPYVHFLNNYDGAAHHIITVANMAGWITDDDMNSSGVEIFYGLDEPEEVRTAWARLLQMARLVMPKLRIYINVVQKEEWREREEENGEGMEDRDGPKP